MSSVRRETLKKGLILALVLAIIAGGSLWAEQPKAPEPLMGPGDLALSVGLGYGFSGEPSMSPEGLNSSWVNSL